MLHVIPAANIPKLSIVLQAPTLMSVSLWIQLPPCLIASVCPVFHLMLSIHEAQEL